MKSLIKYVVIGSLVLSISGCDASTDKKLPRDNVKIADVLDKNKEKQKEISLLNPKEEYAVGIVVAQTPVNERYKLKDKTVSDLISIYEKESGEKVPSGPIKASELRYKELIMKSANVLYVMSYSEADRNMMRDYIAKNLFKKDKIDVIREETVGKIMDDARKEK